MRKDKSRSLLRGMPRSRVRVRDEKKSYSKEAYDGSEGGGDQPEFKKRWR